MGGGNREPGDGHPVNGERRAKGGYEGPGQGVEVSQLTQAMGGAGATEDGAQDDEDTANDGRRRKADHAAADRRAKDIGSVVGAQRPA